MAIILSMQIYSYEEIPLAESTAMGLGKGMGIGKGIYGFFIQEKRETVKLNVITIMLLTAVIKIQKLSYLLVAYVIQICPIKCIITLYSFYKCFSYMKKKENYSFLLFQLDPYLKPDVFDKPPTMARTLSLLSTLRPSFPPHQHKLLGKIP